MTEAINPFKALDFIRDHAPLFAQAKANLLYLTEYRKTKKALLMIESDAKTESAKESYAYAHEEYIEHLKALAVAVQESERLRWLMVGAEAKIEVWRSLEASARLEMKSTQ
jgi:hypothetical protein